MSESGGNNTGGETSQNSATNGNPGNKGGSSSSSSSQPKIGFTFTKPLEDPKKKRLRNAPQEEKPQEVPEYVVSISEGGIQSLNARPKVGPLVIPMPDNRARFVEKKYLEMIKRQKGEGTMESEKKKEEEEEEDLEKEKKKKKKEEGEDTMQEAGIEPMKEEEAAPKNLDAEAIAELEKEAAGSKEMVEVDDDVDLPILLKYRNTNVDIIADETLKFKADVESRPDECDLEDYEKVPVAKFGEALLRGMGWAKDAPIGLTNAKVIQPFEFVKRPGYRTGLGATPAEDPKKPKKWIKPGESREVDEMVLAPKEDGSARHVKTLDEKLVKKSSLSLQVGSLVGIIAGRHDGLYARVMKFQGQHEAVVRLEASSEEVVVHRSDLQLIDERKIQTTDPALLYQEKYEEKSKEGRSSSRSSSSSSSSSKKRERDTKQQEKHNPARREEKSWLFPNLLVRIISKSFAGGKYYLNKAKVYDVMGSTDCTVQLVDSKKLLDVKQRILETVVPKQGEKVMVVIGEHAGQLAKIMEKGKDQAVVQLFSDFSVNTYDFDSICQYVEDRHH